MVKVPQSKHLMRPTLEALKAHDGMATNKEIYDWVTVSEGYSKNLLAQVYANGRGKIINSLNWARTDLRRIGLIESKGGGVWKITNLGKKITDEQIKALMKKDKEEQKKEKKQKAKKSSKRGSISISRVQHQGEARDIARDIGKLKNIVDECGDNDFFEKGSISTGLAHAEESLLSFHVFKETKDLLLRILRWIVDKFSDAVMGVAASRILIAAIDFFSNFSFN